MFGRGFKKTPSTCTFTVHNIHLPTLITDDFDVHWKRAENEGRTERALSNDNVNVFFEKTFNCRVTMYISKKDERIRPKFINFQVNRYLDGITKKVFGKVNVDISRFYNVPPKTEEFEIESPHSKKSSIVLTFSVRPDFDENGNSVEIDADLTSASEAFNLASEHQEDWDISEAVTETQKERIANFFDMRVNNEMASLSAFQSNPRFKRTHSKSNLNESSTDLFIGNIPPPAQYKSTMFNKKQHHNRTPPRLPRRSLLMPPSEIAVPNEFGGELAIKLMHSVLAKQWGESPLDPSKVPQASAALYAMLLETKIFDETYILPSAYEEFQNDFLKRLRLSILVTKATDLDCFIVCIYLVFLLQRSTEHGELRRNKMVKEIISLCSFYIGSIVEKSIKSVVEISRELINGADEIESIAPKMADEIEKAKNSITKSQPFQDFFSKRIIEMTDAKVVDILTQSPLRCTFGNSIQLNSFITIISDKGIELPKAREAITILQMGSVICSDPTSANDLCPTLPKATVARILSNQQPDDFMPMPNDAMNYIRAFDVDMTISPDVPCDYKGDFSEINDKFQTIDWKSTKFEQSLKDELPFLKTYFIE